MIASYSKDDLHTLREVAEEVGRDVFNADGGLPFDADDEIIIETVCDIVQGAPYFLIGIRAHELPEFAFNMIIGYFKKGRNDELVR